MDVNPINEQETSNIIKYGADDIPESLVYDNIMN